MFEARLEQATSRYIARGSLDECQGTPPISAQPVITRT